MNPQNEEILEGLRPRMQAARIAHVRRMIAGLFMVPLIGFGAIAMAAETTDEPGLETAGDDGATAGLAPAAAPEQTDPPDIGEADGDIAPADSAGAPTTTDAPDEVDDPEPEEQTKVLSLGPLGEAEVVETDDGFELLDTKLESGWEVLEVEVTDDGIVVAVTNGDVIKLINITPGVRNEIDVRITDLIIPTTTTTTAPPPPPSTTEKPREEPPAIVDRFVVDVSGKGTFVVERDGDTLWAGNVQPNEGLEGDVQVAEGWKVVVKFTNGEWNWYAKVLINDAGEVEQYFWDEQAAAEPIYQWVEVPGVGAVQFKLWSDGLVYVKNWETSPGYGFYDYNGGAGAEVGKIDFEGEGVLWIVEAWKNADGGLSWSTTDATAPPPA
jgi:hypothetical protein